MKIKKSDLFLFGGVILVSLIILLVINLTKAEGSKVIITVDGEVYDTKDLDMDTTFTVKSKAGGWNTFQIKDGYVDMLDASCPDKLCVEHKKIHYNHETIVCLPNKVVLEVQSAKESEVDIIAN